MKFVEIKIDFFFYYSNRREKNVRRVNEKNSSKIDVNHEFSPCFTT